MLVVVDVEELLEVVELVVLEALVVDEEEVEEVVELVGVPEVVVVELEVCAVVDDELDEVEDVGGAELVLVVVDCDEELSAP